MFIFIRIKNLTEERNYEIVKFLLTNKNQVNFLLLFSLTINIKS